MRNDQQAFTVFGGSFVHESHDCETVAVSRRSAGPLAAVFVALLAGTLTTAGAVAGTQRIHAAGYGFSHSNVIGVPHFQTAAY